MATQTTRNTANKLTTAEYQADLKKAQATLKDAKQVTVNIPKQLVPQIGSILPVGINGAWIRIPVDGEDHEIPEPYLKIVKNSLKTIQAADVKPTLEVGSKEDSPELQK